MVLMNEKLKKIEKEKMSEHLMMNNSKDLDPAFRPLTSLEEKIRNVKEKEARILGRKLISDSLNYLPTDIVTLTAEDADVLTDYWRNEHTTVKAPSDIILSGMVPLLDIIICIDSFQYRVHIDPRYKDSISSNRTMVELDDMKEIPCCKVGYILLSDEPDFYSGHIWSREFFVSPEVDQLLFDEYIGISENENERAIISKMPEHATAMMAYAMAVWYGIQLALLHPRVKEVCNAKHTTTINLPKSMSVAHKKKGKSRKTIKYIKRLEINTSSITDILRGKREYSKHTPYFYVSGHLRHYKNGKTIWIDGYWKGELRELKQKEKVVRNREILIPDSTSV